MDTNALLSRMRGGDELSRKEKVTLAWHLSMPSILSQLTNIAMQYIDAAMVGHLGSNEAAAIGLVASATWLFGGVSQSMNNGFTIQTAQYIGAGENKRARDILWQSFFAMFFYSAMIALIGIGLSGPLPSMLGGDPAIKGMATTYFRIYSAAIPISTMGALFGTMIQVSGNMKTPGILYSCMCILDVIYNYFFIFSAREITLGSIKIIAPGAGLGVAGAAIGTGMAQLTVALIMLYWLLKRTPALHLKKGEKHRFSARDLKKAGGLALPIVFERMVVSGAMVLITKIVAPLGVVAIAANSFSVTVESLCYMPGYGVEDASTTIIGQCIGAGRKKTAVSFGKIVILFGMILMTVTGALMFIFAPWMIGIMTRDKAICDLSVQVLRIEAFAEPLFAASIVAAGVLRGAGDTFVPSIMNFASLWLVRLPLSAFLAPRFGLRGVWIAMATELCVRGIIFLVRFAGGKWVDKGIVLANKE